MKKIDKLVLSSFLGLFVLIFGVALFVLLTQFFLIHFDELIGKGLGLSLYAQLAFYIGVCATPQAFPLAILLSSIMAMGNLGEHFELNALKSAGISLSRILLPLFSLILLLSILVFFSNSYLVPRASLNLFSLLHDMTKKKPSLSIKEGIFYDGIPGYSIKVNKRLDDQTLQGVMIYDHTQDNGNVSLTMADTGKLYTIYDENYLVIELFNGHNYTEGPAQSHAHDNNEQVPPFYRSSFTTQKLVLSLDSFKLSRTKKEIFTIFHKAKNIHQLATDTVTMKEELSELRQDLQKEGQQHLLQLASTELDVTTAKKVDTLEAINILHLKAQAAMHHRGETLQEKLGATASPPAEPPPPHSVTDLQKIHAKALEQAKTFKSKIASKLTEAKRLQREIKRHELERYKMLAWAVSCLLVFLVGAPLGTIIKKGGLGVPLIVSTGLIVWYYITEMLGEKWASAALIDTFSGAWLANGLLLPFGLFFLIQAHRDTRLLEADAYAVLIDKVKKSVQKFTQMLKFPSNR